MNYLKRNTKEFNNIFLDTNIFLRFLVKDNLEMAKDCEKLIIRIKNEDLKAITANLVLAELAWTLSKVYRFSKHEVVRALDAVVSLRGLKIVDSVNSSQALFLYKQFNVKFIDCLLVSGYLTDTRIVFISYDTDFTKLGVRRIEPSYFTQT